MVISLPSVREKTQFYCVRSDGRAPKTCNRSRNACVLCQCTD